MNTIIQPTTQVDGKQTLQGVAPAAQVEKSASLVRQVFHVLLSILEWLAIAILALVSVAMVAVSLLYGPTHWAIALLLAVAWVGLIGLLVVGPSRIGRGHARLGAVLGFVLLGLLTIVISQLSAYTPPIVDAQGNTMPGSITSLEKVRLGGSDQWVGIRGSRG